MELEKYGFKYLPRDPSSFTPSHVDGPLQGKYLLLGSDEKKNYDSIAQFSKKDAEAFPEYEKFLDGCREIIQPLLDGAPPNPFEGKRREKIRTLQRIKEMVSIFFVFVWISIYFFLCLFLLFFSLLLKHLFSFICFFVTFLVA